MLGNLDKGQNVMIYAGASGVGTAAIQLCDWFGAKAFFTASTEDKIAFCEK